MTIRGTQPRLKAPQQSMRDRVIYVDGNPITAQQVTLFLLQHPDFLTDRSQLLASLGIAYLPEYPAAASLVERQIQTLRERNRQLDQQLNDTAKSLQQKNHVMSVSQKLTLELFDEQDPYILLSKLKATLMEEFNIQQIKFFFFKKHLLPSPEYSLMPLLLLHKKLPHWKNIHTAHKGPWHLAEQQALFSKATPQPIALVPFLLNNPFGFMALVFSEDQQDALEINSLNYLGDLVGKLLSRLLALETTDEEDAPDMPLFGPIGIATRR